MIPNKMTKIELLKAENLYLKSKVSELELNIILNGKYDPINPRLLELMQLKTEKSELWQNIFKLTKSLKLQKSITNKWKTKYTELIKSYDTKESL